MKCDIIVFIFVITTWIGWIIPRDQLRMCIPTDGNCETHSIETLIS